MEKTYNIIIYGSEQSGKSTYLQSGLSAINTGNIILHGSEYRYVKNRIYTFNILDGVYFGSLSRLNVQVDGIIAMYSSTDDNLTRRRVKNNCAYITCGCGDIPTVYVCNKCDLADPDVPDGDIKISLVDRLNLDVPLDELLKKFC